jgi:hypothetical protein
MASVLLDRNQAHTQFAPHPIKPFLTFSTAQRRPPPRNRLFHPPPPLPAPPAALQDGYEGAKGSVGNAVDTVKEAASDLGNTISVGGWVGGCRWEGTGWRLNGRLTGLADWEEGWVGGWWPGGRIQVDGGSCCDGWLAGWLAGWLDGWMAGWMAGWLGGWLVSLPEDYSIVLCRELQSLLVPCCTSSAHRSARLPTCAQPPGLPVEPCAERRCSLPAACCRRRPTTLATP